MANLIFSSWPEQRPSQNQILLPNPFISVTSNSSSNDPPIQIRQSTYRNFIFDFDFWPETAFAALSIIYVFVQVFRLSCCLHPVVLGGEFLTAFFCT